MKHFLFLFLFIFLFISCGNRDLKKELNTAFEKKDTKKIESLLKDYYKKNGSDSFLEYSYVKFAILTKNIEKIVGIYNKTPYISIKKDKLLLSQISKIIIEANKKIPPQKRLKFYENALLIFPYSEDIYEEYLKTLLKLKYFKASFLNLIEYDEIFNQKNKYLKLAILEYLKEEYQKTKSWIILDYISKIDLKISTLFLEKLIQKDKKLLQSINKLPKNFSKKILVENFKNTNQSIKNSAIKHFINIANKKEINKEIMPIFYKSPHSQLFIYKNLPKEFQEKINPKLVLKLLEEEKEVIEEELKKEKLQNIKKIIKNTKKEIKLPIIKKDINLTDYKLLIQNKKSLNKEQIKKLSYLGYEKFRNIETIKYYLEMSNLSEIEDFFKKLKIKTEDKYILKLIYYRYILKLTDLKNDEFKSFIENNKLRNVDDLSSFEFNEKHIFILLDLFLKERNSYRKTEIINLIINILQNN